MRRQCASLLFWLTMLAPGLLPAAGTDRLDAPAPVLSEVVQASLFKNGMVYELRETTVPGPGAYEIRNLPTAVHGTFWIEPASEGLRLENVTARETRRKQPQPARRMGELLQANAGRRVELQVRGEGWVAGVLLPGEKPKPPESGPPSVPGPRRAPWEARVMSRETAEETTPPESEIVILQTDKGDQAFRVEEVTGFRCATGEIAATVPGWESGRSLRFEVAAGQGKVRIHMLTRGVTWAPSYRVERLSGDQARVRCRAVVINDAEDLSGAQARFIAGFPNVRFGGATDPLSATVPLETFLSSLSNEGASGRRASPVMAQQVMNAPSFLAEPPELPGATAGTLREDLFLYPPVRLDLRKGERGEFALIDCTVPCRDVYLWDLEDSAFGDDSPSGLDGSPASQEEVWHALRLTNTAKVPWTTAPAVTVQEGDLLGQDLLRYTPPGAPAVLRVSRSLDILAQRTEKEEERQRNAPTEYRGEWDLVTVRGELTVVNGKGKAVTLLARKKITGEVFESLPKATVETPGAGLNQVNPTQVLTWEVPLNPGEVKKMTYRYRVRVRR